MGEAEYEVDPRELDARANEFTLHCLRMTVVAFALVWLLNTLGIFVVDKALLGWTFLMAALCMLAPGLICHFVGIRELWVKYMIGLFAITGVSLTGALLTYHAVLLFCIPLVIAAQYSQRRYIYYIYILTVIGLAVSVMAGYYMGLCDANMLLLTRNSMSSYLDPVTGRPVFTEVNPNPWVTVPLYYIVPRALILLVILPVVRSVSNTIAQNAVYMADLRHQGETDRATLFYNKNKYGQMVGGYYKTLERVAVLFWDINNLKQVNDTLGHAHGDELIRGLAGSISGVTPERAKVYRIGGDEFVMVLENPAPGEPEAVLESWRKRLELQNSLSRLPLSAAVGSAEGRGADIQQVIAQADQRMYEDKRRQKGAGRSE